MYHKNCLKVSSVFPPSMYASAAFDTTLSYSGLG